MKKRLLAAAIAAACTLAFGATAFAGEASETAQIKAEIDKLNAKLAQLEAKQNATAAKANTTAAKQNVTFFFDNRIQYNHTSLGPNDGGAVSGKIDEKGQFMERIRVYMNAKIGDSWEWNSRMHHTKWNLDGADGTGVKFDRFWMTNKNVLDGTLDIGRQGLFPGKALFWNYIGDTDAAVYTRKFDKMTVKLTDARQGGSGTGTKGQEMRFLELNYKPTKKSDVGVLFLKQNNPFTVFGAHEDLDVFSINGATEIPNTNGLALAFEWGKNNADSKNFGPINFKGGQSGYYVALHSSYAGTNIHPMLATSIVNPFKKGDNGWALSYRHMPSGMAGIGNRATASMVPATTDADGSWMNNFDGINAWRFDYIMVPWKNVQWTLTYDRIKPIDSNQKWTNHNIQSVFNFFF